MKDGALLDGLTVEIDTRRRMRRTAVRVLDDVSLAVPAGAMTVLVGESGCGKSMVASALCGLLPPGARSTGAVAVGGADLTDVTGRDRRWRALRGRRVGLVPQSAATSFTPVRTLGSQLDEAIRLLDGPRSAVELCAMVHLDPEALDRYPHELSGGMAQRAAVAAALAGDPDVIVADEPTSALDSALAVVVWDLLGASAGLGAAVLVITHDVESLLGGVGASRLGGPFVTPSASSGLLRGRGRRPLAGSGLLRERGRRPFVTPSASSGLLRERKRRSSAGAEEQARERLSLLPEERACEGLSLLPEERACEGLSLFPEERACEGLSLFPEERACERHEGSDTIAVMRAGRIVEHAPVVDVLRSTDPYVAAFFEPVA